MHRNVEEKEVEIAERYVLIAEQDAQIQRQGVMLDDKDEEIRILRLRILARDKPVAEDFF